MKFQEWSTLASTESQGVSNWRLYISDFYSEFHKQVSIKLPRKVCLHNVCLSTQRESICAPDDLLSSSFARSWFLLFVDRRVVLFCYLLNYLECRCIAAY